MPRPEKHVWRQRNHGRRRKSRHRFKLGRYEIALFLALAVGVILPVFFLPPHRLEKGGGRFDDGRAVVTGNGLRATAPHEGGSVVMSIVSQGGATRLLIVFIDKAGRQANAPATLLSYAPGLRDDRHVAFSETKTGFLSDQAISRLAAGAVLTVSGSHSHRYTVTLPSASRRTPTEIT